MAEQFLTPNDIKDVVLEIDGKNTSIIKYITEIYITTNFATALNHLNEIEITINEEIHERELTCAALFLLENSKKFSSSSYRLFIKFENFNFIFSLVSSVKTHQTLSVNKDYVGCPIINRITLIAGAFSKQLLTT